jgi:hypothetical protein
MEEDYKEYSDSTLKMLDRMGIQYVWRDSCLDILVELRKCNRTDFLSYFFILDNFSNCKGIQKLWKECEYNRESKLMDKYFTIYEKKAKELMEEKKKGNNNYLKNKI